MEKEKIGLKDIIELAKAGLKKDDIFEILDRVDKQNESNPETVDDESNTTPDEEHAEPETEPENDPEAEPEQSEPDYKALYMAEKAKREKLQKNNVNKDNGGNKPEKTDQDVLNEIASSLM